MIDLFVAHAAGDVAAARACVAALNALGLTTFLDVEDLRPGDVWTERLADAQKSAGGTLFLLSKKREKAWYLNHEITAAINLHRASPTAHRLIVINLEPCDAPYGLGQVQRLELNNSNDWPTLAAAVHAAWTGAPVPPPPQAPARNTFGVDDRERMVAVALRYRADRDNLLHYLPDEVRYSLPSKGDPRSQLESDFHTLDGWPRPGPAADPPIATWLRNLLSRVQAFPADRDQVSVLHDEARRRV
jgi:hypothetical protein